MRLKKDAKGVFDVFQKCWKGQDVDYQPGLAVVAHEVDNDHHGGENRKPDQDFPDQQIANVRLGQAFIPGDIAHAQISQPEIGEHFKNSSDAQRCGKNAVLFFAQHPANKRQQDEQEEGRRCWHARENDVFDDVVLFILQRYFSMVNIFSNGRYNPTDFIFGN